MLRNEYRPHSVKHRGYLPAISSGICASSRDRHTEAINNAGIQTKVAVDMVNSFCSLWSQFAECPGGYKHEPCFIMQRRILLCSHKMKRRRGKLKSEEGDVLEGKWMTFENAPGGYDAYGPCAKSEGSHAQPPVLSHMRT